MNIIALLASLAGVSMAGQNGIELQHTPPTRSNRESAREFSRRQIATECRRARVLNCSRQAMQAKQRLIAAGKGKNGRSMSPALLARHAAA